MPVYVYSDGLHTKEVTHSMDADPVVQCYDCARIMHRVPQAVRINWNGLPPHAQHTRSQVVQNMIDHEQENREKFQESSDTNPFNEFAKKR